MVLWRLPCATRAAAFPPTAPTTCSRCSTAASLTGWEWVWRSAARSSKRMADGSTPRQTPTEDPPLCSRFQSPTRTGEMTPKPTVFVVDDDPAVIDAVTGLVDLIDLDARSYLSAADVLKEYKADGPACLVLDGA